MSAELELRLDAMETQVNTTPACHCMPRVLICTNKEGLVYYITAATTATTAAATAVADVWEPRLRANAIAADDQEPSAEVESQFRR